MVLIILCIVAYLLGSITPAIWISRYYYQSDIRMHGSGNAGSTNMYRVFGFWPGFITQLIDITKGSVAAALPIFFTTGTFMTITNNAEFAGELERLTVGICAILGHVYTIFGGFKGGKGVNTILGVMLVVHPVGTLFGIIVFILTLLLSKMVSLSSMAAVASLPVTLLIRNLYFNLPLNLYLLAISLLLAIYIIYTHRTNITRIIGGTERKVNLFKREKSAA